MEQPRPADRAPAQRRERSAANMTRDSRLHEIERTIVVTRLQRRLAIAQQH
jgi:hypothetical protein